MEEIPIRFFHLCSTLHASQATSPEDGDKNVLGTGTSWNKLDMKMEKLRNQKPRESMKKSSDTSKKQERRQRIQREYHGTESHRAGAADHSDRPPEDEFEITIKPFRGNIRAIPSEDGTMAASPSSRSTRIPGPERPPQSGTSRGHNGRPPAAMVRRHPRTSSKSWIPSKDERACSATARMDDRSVLRSTVLRKMGRLRTGTTIITADVEKAFLQIRLHREARDAIYPNPFWSEYIPFLLEQMLTCYLKTTRNQQLAKRLIDNTYVDNVVFTTYAQKEATQFYQESKELFLFTVPTLSSPYVHFYDRLPFPSQRGPAYLVFNRRTLSNKPFYRYSSVLPNAQNSSLSKSTESRTIGVTSLA
uniref:Reverse transcriptase domain-containing protein n=1 Tax=Steinernema glaseri TaxID=37863 RepID=A0A1I7Y5N0_9BILA